MCMNNEGSWRGAKRDGEPCHLIGLTASFPLPILTRTQTLQRWSPFRTEAATLIPVPLPKKKEQPRVPRALPGGPLGTLIVAGLRKCLYCDFCLEGRGTDLAMFLFVAQRANCESPGIS